MSTEQSIDTMVKSTENIIKYCVDPALSIELEALASKYDKSTSDILMLGLSLFKMLDNFKEQNQDLALIEKGHIVRKIVLS